MAAAQAWLSCALLRARHEATLLRSGMNSLQRRCASPAQGCWPPCPGFMSSARCAAAGDAQSARQNAVASEPDFHDLSVMSKPFLERRVLDITHAEASRPPFSTFRRYK